MCGSVKIMTKVIARKFKIKMQKQKSQKQMARKEK